MTVAAVTALVCTVVVAQLVVLSMAAGPATQENHQHAAPHAKLLVLMLDGFKWDYLDLIPDGLGGFSEFIERGVRAEHVNGIYPTLSYPSWTTLSTGLYAESHGILGNYFYNRNEKTAFELHAPNDQTFWWQNAEPIWTSATKQGLRVGTVLWSRSDVPVNDILPEASKGYQLASNWTAIETTLDKSLEYLQSGFNLVMAYGEHIDNIGHKYGPKSVELKDALIDVGLVLERFFDKLTVSGLRDEVNVLVVSDHGMTDASAEAKTRYHRLQTYVNPYDVEYLMDQGALVQIYARPGRISTVYDNLKAMEGVKIYQKQNIPESYHFGNNINAPDILLVAEKGNLMIGTTGTEQVPEAWITSTVQGVHGYEPFSVSDMRTVFMATGPDFKRGTVQPAIDLVDIYQIYCHVLGVSPQPNNGTWEKVKDFFVQNSWYTNSAYAVTAKSTFICKILSLFVGFLLLISLK